MTIALVTDSNAQLPPELRDRYDVRVVPLTVVVDGEPYQEGVNLPSAEFYARLAAGAEVSTAAPSPGDVIGVYEAAAAAGATEILSVHIGSNTSATVNAVKLAVGASPVPVEVVDTGTASFAVACCVWAAGEVLAAGADLVRAADEARNVADEVGNVFIVGALDLARRGGRLAEDAVEGGGLPVLALAGGQMKPVAQVHDADAAVEAMTDYVRATAAGRPQRVGVGDAVAPELARAYEDRLREVPEVAELVRYEIGPSVGAHTGPGTVGACFFGIDR
ncbi:MAG: DegV family protein [Acidimicrobiia bacterium]